MSSRGLVACVACQYAERKDQARLALVGGVGCGRLEVERGTKPRITHGRHALASMNPESCTVSTCGRYTVPARTPDRVRSARAGTDANPESCTVGGCAVSPVAFLSVLHTAVGSMLSTDRVPAGGSGCVFGESAPRCAEPQSCSGKRCRVARNATGMAPADGVNAGSRTVGTHVGAKPESRTVGEGGRRALTGANSESRTVGAEGRLPRGLWGRRARGTC